jgi:hypothetical protein
MQFVMHGKDDELINEFSYECCFLYQGVLVYQLIVYMAWRRTKTNKYFSFLNFVRFDFFEKMNHILKVKSSQLFQPLQ